MTFDRAVLDTTYPRICNPIKFPLYYYRFWVASYIPKAAFLLWCLMYFILLWHAPQQLDVTFMQLLPQNSR